jgi:hypothetical protein
MVLSQSIDDPHAKDTHVPTFCSRQQLAHLPHSLRCGDRVRLQSYVCCGGVASSMRADGPRAAIVWAGGCGAASKCDED